MERKSAKQTANKHSTEEFTPSKAESTSMPPSSSPIHRMTKTQLYLFQYNVVSAFFWFAVLLRVVAILPILGPENIAEGNANFIKWVQTGALLEIVHSLLGLVRSPILTTLMQVASRILLVWGVVYLFPESGATTLAYSTMVISWSVTEIIRYAYYAYNLNGGPPKWLTWLRYNTFLLLYPTGVTSELLVIYASLGDAEKFSPYYKWFLVAIFVIYVPGFRTMFGHMVKQRNRVFKLAESTDATKKPAATAPATTKSKSRKA
ncbi:tyrosine phosphatase-like protein [Lipomyces arxii]|uniref:tyrosine phosphatase-like protein n=1 Tax=Lipomyces arxii TaxID=56418 RepID=UPI0034CF6A38